MGDIINNLSKKIKPVVGNRKEKFVFYSTITGAIQRLKRSSRVNYINRAELKTCLLSQSTLSSIIRLLPISEYDLWVQEMTIAGLDFKNPVGIETFNIKRNKNKSSRSDPTPKEVQNMGVKKIVKSMNKIFRQEDESSGSENEATIMG